MSGLYNQTVPVFIHYLRNLSHLLKKGAQFCEEKEGVTAASMLSFRLIEDMRGLPFQVQSCSNTAKFTIQRIGNHEVPTLEDNESTFEELQARIERTIQILEMAKPEAMDALADKEVIMETKMGNFRFATGQEYVSNYAIPNFHFHLTTAYCIMRHLGVPLGAMDYLKDVFHKV
ncbi:hypothetical protein UA08_06359 [Talaromyces atroroseus]|uniref:DUF1993 domain-containing protein n=1 Tax=Talaromyces atroroseus TaxID=1441469 RepID=A0A225AJP2_TALAT|nr:hypothetical protein UA08_06359 [Talaromyces atroroseus]OKL58494.1 hypothetical protein UA08_06359 [Talaromyces atroroseus]